MSLANILNATTYTGFGLAEEALTEAAIINTYNNSVTARTMYEDWIDAGKTISISNKPNVFQAFPGTGIVNLDISYIDKLYYIDNFGNSVKYPYELALAHELVHAIRNIRDNVDVPDGDYRGDTVIFANYIHEEMGFPLRNSYLGANFDDVIKPGFAYTGGAEIDRSHAAVGSWSSTGTLEKGTLYSRDLLIGSSASNSLEGNLGDDFLLGGGGDDFLNGGLGGTDTVVFYGKPIDYDIRLNPDGTWTSDHVRGASDEGRDTLLNFERVRFGETDTTFNLVKSGLSWQTDFAFVIDQTESMADNIAAVKSVATGVVGALFAGGTTDARIGIVGFRDTTNGEPTTVIQSFTDQDALAARQIAAIDAINGITVGGGGGFSETAYDGLLTALDGSMGEWRAGAGVRKIALFTDAGAKDVSLLSAVLGYAQSIGAAITSSTKAAFGDVATIDSFELGFGLGDASGVFPDLEGEALPTYTPSGDLIEAPGGTAIVQIITIFMDAFMTPDPSFSDLATATGGSVEVASNPAELIERLLGIITTTNYNLTLVRDAIDEGDSGSTEVVFTVSRDRVDSASTVSFETTGDTALGDVTGAPTTIEFAAGEVTKTFTVNVVGNTVVEADKTFGIKITSVTGEAAFSSDAASLIIRNDDATVIPEILGTTESDHLVGTDGADAIRSLAGSYDLMTGGAGADQFIFGSEANNGVRERNVILDYEVGIDEIVLEEGVFVASIRQSSSQVVVFLEGDFDAIYVRGSGVTADNITIVTDDVFSII
jgi:Ca2+-binding RTX toxin-like protein